MSRTDPFVFDGIAEIYDATRALRPEIMEKVVSSLAREMYDCSSILDVGIGTGRYAVPLSEKGIGVTGIDFSKKMVAQARAKGFHRIVFGDAKRMPFKDASFDCALMVHVLHLIPEWMRVVSEISRVAGKGLISVAVERRPRLQAREDYIKIIDSSQYGPAFPGKHEWELAEILRPDTTLVVHEYVEETPADILIGRMERREYSWARKLPDEMHERAMREIKDKWAGKVHRVDATIKVMRWGRERLKSLCSPRSVCA